MVTDTGQTGARRRGGASKRAAIGAIAVGSLVAAMLSGTSASPSTAMSAPVDTSSPIHLKAPALTAATFADPPKAVRPSYYWWMPQAETDEDELVREIDQMSDAGAGSVLMAPVQRPSDPVKYGWGTPAWADRVENMMAAAKADGLQMNLSQGPRWPALVPSVTDVNDPRASQQMIFADEFHKGGTSRDGALPSKFNVAPPAGANKTLIAALVARCDDANCDTQTTSPRPLDPASVTDVTAGVDADGNLHYDFPGDASSTYTLFAFYQTASGTAYSGFSAKPMYELDHLSTQGVQATTDYFDEHVLTPRTRELIAQMGDVGLYENSLELDASLKWTWDFAKEWQQRRGYPVTKVLPLLTGPDTLQTPTKPLFDFGGKSGDRVQTDYRQTWSDIYINTHLEALNDWAHGHGIHVNSQAYGPPVDIAAASTKLDVPGGESLGFGDDGSPGRRLAFGFNTIEDYKVVAVGAHMSGGTLTDLECCAHRSVVWGSTAAGDGDTANLPAIYNGLAGGMTRVVWHGFPYRQLATGTQSVWPGMSYGGNTSFAEAYGPSKTPSWSSYRQINDHLGRLGLVLRQGTPRFDVATYWQALGLNGHGTTGAGENRQFPSSSAMAKAGYTYEYISPEHLRSPEARYEKGALFPDRSAYKALVLNDQTTMPVDVATKLVSLANEGLHVLIVGRLPQATPGYDERGSEDAELRAVIAKLVSSPNVEQVADEADLPAALNRAGVHASAAHEEQSSAVLSVRRQAAGSDYYFLYNQTPTAATQTVTLTGEGVPYRLNTWTGKITRIADYTAGQGTVTVPVNLQGHGTSVIAIAPEGSAQFGDAEMEPRPKAPAATARLQPETLRDWSLNVASWTPGDSGHPDDTKHTELGPVAVSADGNDELPTWSKISPETGYSEDLRDVSGIGTYTTHVRLGSGWDPVKGAQLSLGTVVDTASVTVNGHQVRYDFVDGDHIEVGPYLRNGDNTITVEVASTLLNAVRKAPGTGASGRKPMDYGLIGPVKLTPVTPVRIEPLEDALPLAAGGFNRSQVQVSNSSRAAQTVEITASAPGIAVQPEETSLKLEAGASKVVTLELRNGGVATGTTTLKVSASGRHGATSDAKVVLHHSANLALNNLGTPFPRPFASGEQDRYAPSYLTDGTSAFWVSDGELPGRGPTAEQPVMVGVDLGGPTTVGSVHMVGRSNYGPRTYDVQVSDDGRTWRTVASEVDAPKAGKVSTFAPVTARFVRLRITDGYYSSLPAVNVQMTELEVGGA